MMRHLLLLFLLLPTAACGLTTPVALVDSYYGFEHVRNDRSAHLESIRADISPAGTTHETERHCFRLQVMLGNNSAKTWTVSRKDWSIEIQPCDGVTCSPDIKVQLAGDGDVMIAVPPGSSSPMTVLFEILIPKDRSLNQLERFPVELVLKDGTDELMKKRFSIGVFDQLGQAVRMFGVVTVALLALSFL